jgi:hypothetical protein
MKAYTGNNLEAINPMIDSTHEEIRDTINTLDRRYESNFLKNLKSPDKSHASRIRLLENVICGMTQVVGQQTIKAVQIFNMTIIFLVLGTTAFLKLLQMYLQYQAISNQHGNVQA